LKYVIILIEVIIIIGDNMKTKYYKLKKVTIILAIVAVLLIGAISIAYAYIRVSTSYDSTLSNIDGELDCLDITYSESGLISANENYPISDTYALTRTPVTVTITNNCTTNLEDISYVLAFTSLKNNTGYIPDNKMRIATKRKLNSSAETNLTEATYLNSLDTITSGNTYTYLNNKLTENNDTNIYTNKTHYVIDKNTIGAGETNTYKVYVWIDYYEGDTTHTGLNDNTTEGLDFKGTISFVVNSEKVVRMPSIGNFVTLDNESGIYYRVLYNTSWNTFMLLRMNNDLGRVAFDSSGTSNVYAGSTLDTYMNETFYNTLSTNIKNAMVANNISQGTYSLNSGTPSGTYYMKGTRETSSTNYYITQNSTTNVGSRKVYALDISDVKEYLGADNLSLPNINGMFFNTTGNTTVSYFNDSWLRSSYAAFSNHAWIAFGLNGDLGYTGVGNKLLARPAFLIDLSLVNFEEIDPSTISCGSLGNEGC